jgi:hypothetical protein
MALQATLRLKEMRECVLFPKYLSGTMCSPPKTMSFIALQAIVVLHLLNKLRALSVNRILVS